MTQGTPEPEGSSDPGPADETVADDHTAAEGVEERGSSDPGPADHSHPSDDQHAVGDSNPGPAPHDDAHGETGSSNPGA